MNYEARVTPGGELVLPADLARELGFFPGDAVEVDGDVAQRSIRLRAIQGWRRVSSTDPAQRDLRRDRQPSQELRDRVDRFLAERADDWDE